jgi:hypothetical protein
VNILNHPWPLIGVCYLPPLIDHPDTPGMQALIDHALSDYRVMIEAGFEGILLENENDRPYSIKANAQQIESMLEITRALADLKSSVDIGVEFLINDPYASLMVASEGGAQFIRTDYYVDKMYRKEYGVLEVDQVEFQKYRDHLKAHDIAILADVQVKYAQCLEENKPIELSVQQTKNRHASAALISSEATGVMPSVEDFKRARQACDQKLFVGSGLTLKNLETLNGVSDGAVVGTAILENGTFNLKKCLELSHKRNSLLDG